MLELKAPAPFTNMQATTERFSNVRLGHQSDNQAILDFYASVRMNVGAIQLRYDRSPDFFEFLRCQGERSFVIIFERDEPAAEKGSRRVGGVATIAIRSGSRDGQRRPLVYLADLRLSPNLERKSRLQFRRWYETLVNTAEGNVDLGEGAVMYSAILDDNRLALASLVREEGAVRYTPTLRYRAISVFGRWPLIHRFRTLIERSGWKIEKIGVNHHELAEFLRTSKETKKTGFDFHEDLKHRRANWPDFQKYPFLVARDQSGKIVASALPWDGCESRQAVIDQIPWRLRVAGQFLPLLRGRRVKRGQKLKALYLTHFEYSDRLDEAGRARATRLILDHIFTKSYFKHHMIQLLETDEASFSRKLTGYYCQVTPGSIYEVSSRDRTAVAHGASIALEVGII